MFFISVTVAMGRRKGELQNELRTSVDEKSEATGQDEPKEWCLEGFGEYAPRSQSEGLVGRSPRHNSHSAMGFVNTVYSGVDGMTLGDLTLEGLKSSCAAAAGTTDWPHLVAARVKLLLFSQQRILVEGVLGILRKIRIATVVGRWEIELGRSVRWFEIGFGIFAPSHSQY